VLPIHQSLVISKPPLLTNSWHGETVSVGVGVEVGVGVDVEVTVGVAVGFSPVKCQFLTTIDT